MGSEMCIRDRFALFVLFVHVCLWENVASVDGALRKLVSRRLRQRGLVRIGGGWRGADGR